MQHFEYSSWINAPVEAVFAFHERRDALERLTPPGQRIEVVSKEGGIETGARVELRIHAGPFSIKWLALHVDYEKDRLFVDEQMRGPFRKWVHRHQFAVESGGTRLTDSIEFALPGGRAMELLGGRLVRRQLRKMFAYRHAVTLREVARSHEPR